MKAIVTTLLGLLLACVGLAYAQDYYAPYYQDNRASTPGESYARGMSDVIRAQGQNALLSSQAAINMTEAQREYMRNRDEWTNTYFQMRDANRTYRAKERGERPTVEDLVRYAQAGKPKPLSPSDLDQLTGGIAWPSLLTSDQFANDRAELEQLFTQRADAGGLSWDDRQKVGQVTKEMLADLRKLVRKVPQMEYIASRRFLESLAYEAQRPAS